MEAAPERASRPDAREIEPDDLTPRERPAPAPELDLEAAPERASTPAPETEALHNKLTLKEKATLAKHYGRKAYDAVAQNKFAQDFAKAVANGLRAVPKVLRAIISRIQKAVLSGAVVITTTGVTPVPADVRSMLDNGTGADVSIAQVNLVPAEVRDSMSDTAQNTYDVVAPAAVAAGKAFMIADKPTGKLYIFDANGMFLTETTAIYGSQIGDVLPQARLDVRSYDAIEDSQSPLRVTPSGLFSFSVRENAKYPGGLILGLAAPGKERPVGIGERGGSGVYVALHGNTVTTEERRRAFETPTAADNKQSMGCVVLSPEFFTDTIAGNIDVFADAVIAIVPDQVAGTEFASRLQDDLSGVLSSPYVGARTGRDYAAEDLVADQPSHNKPIRTAIREFFLAPVAARLSALYRGSLRGKQGEYTASVKERIRSKYSGVEDIYQPEMDRQIMEQFGIDVSQLPPEANLAKVFKLFESSKNGRQLLVMRNHVYKITDKLKELGVGPQDIGMYLWARGVKDRNALIGKRDSGNPDNGAGMTNAEATEIIQTLQEKDNGELFPKLQEIAKMHDALVDLNLKMRVDAGILSKKQAAAFKKTQPYYASLKGWAEAEDMQSFGEMNSVEDALNLNEGLFGKQGGARNKKTQTRLGVKPKEFLKSQGRTSMPFNPLFNLFADTANVVANATQNEVGRKLLQINREYPEAHEGTIRVYNEAEGKKKFKISDDLTTPEGSWGKVDLPSEVRNGNMMLVKENGENFFVEFANTDSGQALKRAFSNMQPAYFKNIIGRGLARGTQAFKSALTRYNPSYIPVAYVRDTMDALVTAKVVQGLTNSPAQDKKLAGKIASHVMPVFGTPHVRTSLVKWLRGKPPTNEMEAVLHKQLEDMIYYGGSVGHANVMAVEDYAKQIERKIKAQGSGSPVLKGVQAVEVVGAALDGAAQFVDLQARFATYLAAIQEGVSKEDAAILALDSSLDLTQRGSLSQYLDLAIPFFSPAVGGTAKIGRFLASKSGRKAVGAMMLIGSLLSLWNQWMGGEDDDGDGESNYDEIAEYVKQSNLIIFYGSGVEDYARIPTGFMVGLPNYIGTLMSETGVKAAKDPARTPALLTEALGRAGAGTIAATSPIRSFYGVFGIAQPAVDLVRNENFFGDPIYNEASQYDNRINAELGRAGTNQFWKDLARGISDLTGGTSVKDGKIGLQPEMYRYLFQSYATIGPGDFLSRATRVATDYNPDQTLAQQLPVIRRFTSAPTDYNTMSEFYENTEESTSAPSMEAIMSEVRDGNLRTVWEEYAGTRNEYRTDPGYIDAYADAKSELDSIYRERRERLDSARSPEQREAVLELYEPRVRGVQLRANRQFNAIRQRYERR